MCSVSSSSCCLLHCALCILVVLMPQCLIHCSLHLGLTLMPYYFSFCSFIVFFLLPLLLYYCVCCVVPCAAACTNKSLPHHFPRILSPPAVIRVLFFTASSLFNTDDLNFMLDMLCCPPSATCEDMVVLLLQQSLPF